VGRFDREWSRDEVDLSVAQFADSAADTSMVHACVAVEEGGGRRLRSLCGLLDVRAAAVDDRLRFATLAGADASPYPRCHRCAESGAFDAGE
jgi:hypothetical protein